MDKQVMLDAIKAALQEDLGPDGDITSKAISKHGKINFAINSREAMVVCGVPILQELFAGYQDDIEYAIIQEDGTAVEKNTTIISGTATAYTLFSIERIALNFLQHLSGVATITKAFVDNLKHTEVVIRDTRKTTPGLRALERYAVHVGGGHSYRHSLSDQILIKDNHIVACGGDITAAITQVKQKFPKQYIAVECDTLIQVEAALLLEVDLILLDNMSVVDIKQAIAMAAGTNTKLEASGGVTLRSVQEIAATGVSYISIGALTHSAPNTDIGLDVYI